MFVFTSIVMFFFFLATNGAILDSRCYLEGGGSAESFLATEDLAVGSIIGRLRINGDPTADTGDINLSLREKHAPVEIVPGTKDLALAVELDKEGLRGPSSIYVNVICVRRRSTDPVRLKVSFKVTQHHLDNQSNLVTILSRPCNRGLPFSLGVVASKFLELDSSAAFWSCRTFFRALHSTRFVMANQLTYIPALPPLTARGHSMCVPRQRNLD